jgi:hypothetical protein
MTIATDRIATDRIATDRIATDRPNRPESHSPASRPESVERQVKTFSFIPKPGERIFSVNLAMEDVGQLWPRFQAMGFDPEVVQLTWPHSTVSETHALLWQGPQSSAPADLEEKYDQLSEEINPDAIYYALGRGPVKGGASLTQPLSSPSLSH